MRSKDFSLAFSLDATRRTSNPASEILSSMSNLCSNAWVLMIATVLVRDADGLEEIDASRREFPEAGDDGEDDMTFKIPLSLRLVCQDIRSLFASCSPSSVVEMWR